MTLYLRHRPNQLSDVFGNENAIASLRALLKKKEDFPTAILIYGPTGCGKTTIARIIKKELGCRDEDFTELNMANTRGIDTIREIIQASNYGTFSGGAKIYLIDECHKLTNDAQNALLKVLEDTPPKVYFILCTTDPEKVIATVRNRCSTFKVSTLPSFIISSLLEKVCRAEGKSIAKDVLKEITRVGKGSPRSSLNLLEKELDVDPKGALKELEDLDISESKTKDIIYLLLKSKSADKWEQMSKLIKNLEQFEPEAFRVGILNYFSKVLLGEEKVDGLHAGRVSLMMECFSQPFLYGGYGLLVNALFKASSI